MKLSSVILLRDTSASLSRIVSEAVPGNPLLGAFCEWLNLGLQDSGSLDDAAIKAAEAKGGERSSRGLALLGFRCGGKVCTNEQQEAFRKRLDWNVGKPNFDAAGEPSSVVVDPLIFLGICVGAQELLQDQQHAVFYEWARRVVADAEKTNTANEWQAGLPAAIGTRYLSSPPSQENRSPLWLRAALAHTGLFKVSDEHAAEVLSESLQSTEQLTDGFEAALRLSALGWARGRALDMDLHALTVPDVVQILKNVPRVFLRWTWEDKPRTTRRGAEPRKWHIENEYHVQSLLFAVLKPIFPELDEEKYLASTGRYQPRADLCLPSLQLLIEVKHWYLGGSIKDLTEQVASDHSLYLRPDSPYRSMIAVIWDDGARTEEYAEFEKGLMGLANMRAVIFISRPSKMMNSKSAA